MLPLADWLQQRGVMRYYLRWRPRAAEIRGLGLFALPMVVPASVLEDLRHDDGAIVRLLLASVGGVPQYRQHNALDELIRRSLALVIDRDLLASADRYRRISLFVDEVSNVINQPLIEILNKGAEGGILTTCAMQTLADLARRLGNEHAARMALGNLNNLIALRSKDRPTQDFVVETFGKTAIHALRVSLSNGADAHLGDFSSSYSTQLAESIEEMVPADVLGKLPNLQYFASVSGGRILKGRLPILDPDAAAPAAAPSRPPPMPALSPGQVP